MPLISMWVTLALVVLAGCGRAAVDPYQGGVGRPKPEIQLEVPGHVARLVDSLYADDELERAYAAAQLGQLGPEAQVALPFLIDALDDSNWQVRQRSAEALGAVEDRQGVAPLLALLADRDEDWSARAAAARALGQLGDPEAAEALLSVLNDMSTHVRHMAVVALGEIGDPGAAEALEMAAKFDPDLAARFAAAESLRRIRQKAAPGEEASE